MGSLASPALPGGRITMVGALDDGGTVGGHPASLATRG